MFVLAVMGIGALYLLFGWLLSAIIASLLSAEKGYGERPGLASGLIVPPVGVVLWLFMPPREGSGWKVAGPSNGALAMVAVSGLAGLGALAAAFIADVTGAAQVLLILFGVLLLAGVIVCGLSARGTGRAATA